MLARDYLRQSLAGRGTKAYEMLQDLHKPALSQPLGSQVALDPAALASRQHQVLPASEVVQILRFFFPCSQSKRSSA